MLQGKLPDYNEPVVVPLHKASLEDFCNRIHKTFIKQFKYALVWGTSTKHRPQKVNISLCMCCSTQLLTMRGMRNSIGEQIMSLLSDV